MSITLAARKVGTRAEKKKILIVCEGSRTEPEYFQAFRVPKEVCEIKGSGNNTISLIKQAKILSDKSDYNEVWCVFDRDSFPKTNILGALRLAEKYGFKCAFSNESFELWYVLHFEYLDTQITRKQYCSKLSKHLGFKYSKGSQTIYKHLKLRQSTAIKNATKLLNEICPQGSCRYDARPTTTVHELVVRLNKMAMSK